MAEATTAFGVASLRDAISKSKTDVTDMYLDAGINLTAAQQNIINTQMFLADGTPNPRFKVGEFWKDTFGKAREGSEKFDLLASIMDGSVFTKIATMVSKLPGNFGGMIMGFLRSLPVVGKMFGEAKAEGDDEKTPEGVKSYIDEALPAPAAPAAPAGQQPALVAGAPSPASSNPAFSNASAPAASKLTPEQAQLQLAENLLSQYGSQLDGFESQLNEVGVDISSPQALVVSLRNPEAQAGLMGLAEMASAFDTTIKPLVEGTLMQFTALEDQRLSSASQIPASAPTPALTS